MGAGLDMSREMVPTTEHEQFIMSTCDFPV